MYGEHRPRSYGCRSCWVAVALLAALVLLLLPAETRRRMQHLHWLPYVLPRSPSWVWDYMHGQAARTGGGMWRYGPNVQSELTRFLLRTHPKYSSLLDVACNDGYMLARLARARPNAAHYGTDISEAMVRSTRARCASCAGVAALDLASLALDAETAAAAGERPLSLGLPSSFELVVVSDVLYYIPHGRMPPILGRFLPAAWRRSSERRLMESLTRLASKEVIFSDHEEHPRVVEFLQSNGATRHLLAPNGRRGRVRSVWTAPGRARRAS